MHNCKNPDCSSSIQLGAKGPFFEAQCRSCMTIVYDHWGRDCNPKSAGQRKHSQRLLSQNCQRELPLAESFQLLILWYALRFVVVFSDFRSSAVYNLDVTESRTAPDQAVVTIISLVVSTAGCHQGQSTRLVNACAVDTLNRSRIPRLPETACPQAIDALPRPPRQTYQPFFLPHKFPPLQYPLLFRQILIDNMFLLATNS